MDSPELTPEAVYRFYLSALGSGNRELATTVLIIMAESCPLRKPECLNTRFCPDCRFYNPNVAIESELETTITNESKEGHHDGQ